MRAWAVVMVVAICAACSGSTPRPVRPSVPAPAAVLPPTAPSTAAPVPTSAAPAPAKAPASPLAASLDRVLATTDSCLVVTDERGSLLYARNPDLPLAPASTQKLLVAATALERLGPGFRFTTTVVATRPPSGGWVDDLWLVGGGDPLLASPAYVDLLRTIPATAAYQLTPLAGLADAVIASGVRHVRNGLHGDDSRYERLRYLPVWQATLNHGEFDVGPLSALEVDQGLDAWRPAIVTADPPGHAAGVLAALVSTRGTPIAAAGDGRAPADGLVVARMQSAPLAQVVTAMLQASDNQIAELLVRELDRQAGGAGTTSGGVKLVMATAARLGVPAVGMSMVDGSGLSQLNRVTCRALLTALSLGDRAKLSALSTGLPVAGVSGSLADLFRGTPVAGRLAAKGGYITGVTALVGRLAGARPVRFAFVANGAFDYAAGVAFTGRVVDALMAP